MQFVTESGDTDIHFILWSLFLLNFIHLLNIHVYESLIFTTT